MAEVDIQGIFGSRFLKESFTINIKEKASIKKVFKKIDKHLKVRFFRKHLKKLPKGVVILVNGQPIRSPLKDRVLIKDSDQISILRILAGG
ncbi:MAG: MoaD/ThiS family protein [Thermodesulfobacteriota bacterium]|nr:MoaD/ThiS family protein [Thermodesulfobacteriota bacterium]